MAWGIRTKLGGVVVYDSLNVDIGRFLVTIDTGSVAGSWTAPTPIRGRMDYQVSITNYSSQWQGMMPVVTISGDTISWAWQSFAGTTPKPPGCFINVWVV